MIGELCAPLYYLAIYCHQKRSSTLLHILNVIYLKLFVCSVLYQLPNGKTIYLTIEEYLSLTDGDIQYLVSINYGEAVLNPFKDSAVDKQSSEKEYDFDYLNLEDEELCDGNILTDESSYDDIIDIPEDLDI